MLTRLKSMFHLFVPAHVDNPFRLARRMLSSRNRTALFTLFIAAFGILCIPLDLLLSIRERRLLSSAAAMPARPTVFVCGPARSGTTLTFQILCRHLDVSYLQNVTALFPRSPIVASRIYRRLFGPPGRLFELQELLRKDQRAEWPDRSQSHLESVGATGCDRFQDETFRRGRPGNGPVHLCVWRDRPEGDGLEEQQHERVCRRHRRPQCRTYSIICLRRSPEFLAQSLLQARLDIHGSVSHGYGVQDVEDLDDRTDPIASVCSQVAFLNRKARESQSRVGEDRFWIVDYEEICADPGKFVAAVSEKLGIPMPRAAPRRQSRRFRVHNVVRDEKELERIRARLRVFEATG